ncbi:MAG: hypothetical protein KDK48_04750 [Chlamydiia bacterium]|nr:hypothetical protein [Chlamydiia bacterium]
MTRMSKQGKRRNTSPRRPNIAGQKTGSKKDALPKGYKVIENAVEGELSKTSFIPKIK